MAHQAERESDGLWLCVGLLIGRFKVYVVGLDGENRKEVTSGKHGATHTPVFSNDGTKVAWTELAEDGYESDRAVIVVYDLKKDESYNLAPHWDRSPASLIVRVGLWPFRCGSSRTRIVLKRRQIHLSHRWERGS